MLLGSVAEEIIREAPCPVLTVGPHAMTLASAGIHSIVCASDFSPASLRAAEIAVSLAHEYQAHLTLVHVVEGVSGTPRISRYSNREALTGNDPSEPELSTNRK